MAAATRTSPGGRPAPLRVRFVVHGKWRGGVGRSL
jgi:hypothetical protein